MKEINKLINFPLISNEPDDEMMDPSHSFDRFILMLRAEEDYWQGEQTATNTMITRLRKIFYGDEKWDKYLIPDAKHIEGRYDCPAEYVVKVKKGDRLNPNVGATPEIFSNENQNVFLPEGNYCDIGHVLAGMDCYNNFGPVTILPHLLTFLDPFVPHGESNMDISTWIGDIASVCGEILLKHIITDTPTFTDFESATLEFAGPSDMVGNIDGYVISNLYNLKTNDGARVSDILKDYYCSNSMGNTYRQNRFTMFCSAIGLKEFNGKVFENESEWIKYNKHQLRTATAMYVFPKSKEITFDVILRLYDDMLGLELLLDSFVASLKKQLKLES